MRRLTSDRLVEILTDQKLCTRAELIHCEPHVRRLCHDLPDFDSVWLDALCPAKIPDSLAGRSTADRWCRSNNNRSLSEAARLDSRRIWRLTRNDASSLFCVSYPKRQSLEMGRPNTSISSSKSFCHRSIVFRGSIPAALVLPQEVIEYLPTHRTAATAPESAAGRRFLVSDFIAGWSMEELLIRGGRLPWEVVAEIGRELLTALVWLESARLLHGDLVRRESATGSARRYSSRGCVLAANWPARIRIERSADSA